MPKNPNTDLDVWLEDFPRVAGIESGRLHNKTWLDCPFQIVPAKDPIKGFQRGFKWTATFVATDDPSQHRVFDGLAETRTVARYAVVDTLTKYMSLVADQRKAWVARQSVAEQLSEAAGVPVAE